MLIEGRKRRKRESEGRKTKKHGRLGGGVFILGFKHESKVSCVTRSEGSDGGAVGG